MSQIDPPQEHELGLARCAVVGAGTRRHLILPLENRRAAAEAISQSAPDTSIVGHAKRAMARTALRFGLLQPFLRTRLSVRETATDPSEPTLHEYLARAIGSKRIWLAVRFGPIRPNQKPIVRIMDESGTTIAFAKVGWNELTRDLVDHELAFLSRIDDSALRQMAVPMVIHHGDWNGHRVLVLGALDTARGSREQPPSAALYREIATLDGPLQASSLAESVYHVDLADRIAGLPGAARIEGEAALGKIAETAGSEPMDFGRWHGDLTPWNVAQSSTRLLVWDWERTHRPVPLGLDAIHYAVQPSFSGGRSTASESMRKWEPVISRTLSDLGLPSALHPLVAQLYLLELYVRFGTAAADGDQAAIAIQSSVDEALRAHIGH